MPFPHEQKGPGLGPAQRQLHTEAVAALRATICGLTWGATGVAEPGKKQAFAEAAWPYGQLARPWK